MNELLKSYSKDAEIKALKSQLHDEKIEQYKLIVSREKLRYRLNRRVIPLYTLGSVCFAIGMIIGALITLLKF